MTVDVEQRIHLNTAISALMELVNEMYAFGDAALKAAAVRPQSASALREAIEALVDHDLALRAAHGRRAVGDDRPRRRHRKGVVAVVR